MAAGPPTKGAARMAPDADLDFDALYRRLAPRVYAYVLRRVRHQHDAEDITGEVFVRAYRTRSKPRAGSVDAWVFTIARNLVIDRARRDRLRGLRLPLLRPGSEAVSPHGAADDQMALRALLDDLPPATRDAVLLRVAAGLSTAEAAQVLGKRPEAVKMLVYRGLTTLRRRWREEVAP